LVMVKGFYQPFRCVKAAVFARGFKTIRPVH
jgi:hypothetical protein